MSHGNKQAKTRDRNARQTDHATRTTGSKATSNSSISAGDGEITIFLSYSRADDRAYGMVRPFKELLSHFIYAKSGRKVRTFLDQDDIEWGDIWMDRLESEILGASVFIPLLSASYLDSDNCRMEFNRFQTNASALGVRELLLPVLLLDAPAIFNKYSTDDVVREAAARQWEVIEDAVLADDGAGAWKRTMARLADRFVKSYDAAESKLASLNESDLPPALEDRPDGSDENPDDDDDDAPGLAELMSSIQGNISLLTQDATAIAPAIQDLGKAASTATADGSPETPQQLQSWARRAAGSFLDPSNRLSESGESMFNTTKALDVDMQRLRRIGLEVLPDNAVIAHGYNDMIEKLSGLEATREQLESLLTKMKPAEVMSVPLRKSLRPARRGLTRVNDSLRLIETWRKIDLDD